MVWRGSTSRLTSFEISPNENGEGADDYRVDRNESNFDLVSWEFDSQTAKYEKNHEGEQGPYDGVTAWFAAMSGPYYFQ